MSAVNIIQIRHPSGKLFEDYCRFVQNHPEASYFQSADFLHVIDELEQADWVLLLAVRTEGLKDPGARPASFRPGEIFNMHAGSQAEVAQKSSAKAEVGYGRIAGSMLAVNVREKSFSSSWNNPFAGVYRMMTAHTIACGGPLLDETTRLQKELTTKALFNALHSQFHKRSIAVHVFNIFDMTDFIPLYREMGYRYFDCLNKGDFQDVLTFRMSILRIAENDYPANDNGRERLVQLRQQLDRVVSFSAGQAGGFGCFFRINQAVRYFLLASTYKLLRLFKGDMLNRAAFQKPGSNISRIAPPPSQ